PEKKRKGRAEEIIFQHLSLLDRARASSVCRCWNDHDGCICGSLFLLLLHI
uniref:F-box domain-containing protein n=1 Tax=Poecilia reticulata TaxID=8081 RepID=A0A3P9NFK5_POERE